MSHTKKHSIFNIQDSDVIDFKTNVDRYKKDLQYIIQDISKENIKLTISEFNEINESSFINIKEMMSIYNFHSTNNNSDKVTKNLNEMRNYYISEIDTMYHDKNFYEVILNLKEEDSQDKILKDLMIKRFEDNGINLSEEDKKELTELKKDLGELTSKFMLNINKSRAEMEYILENNSLISESEKELFSSKKDNGEDVYFLKFGNKMNQALATCESEDLRKGIYNFTKRIANEGEYDNSSLIEDIVEKKKEIASIMGYKSVGENVFSNNTMAKGFDEASGFINKISKTMLPLAKEEDKELLKFGQSIGVNNLEPHNIPFLEKKMKAKTFDIEAYAECEYLKLDKVLEASLSQVEKLFRIQFEKDDSTPLNPGISEDIKTYRAFNEGKEVATVIFDLKERDGKKGGAMASPIFSPSISKYGLISVNTNFNKDSDGLQFGDVKTLLHEMGHMVHHLSTKTKYSDFSGTVGMSRDSVEIPSQMLEKFYLDRDFLNKASDNKLPEDLIEKTEKAKSFRVANFYCYQSSLARFDLDLYNNKSEKPVREQYMDAIEKGRPRKPDTETNFPNVFTHIFSGIYNSGYYGYLFSDVYSVDAYTHISKEPEKRGLEFKEKVLSKGSGENFMGLYIDFKGKKASMDNFMKYHSIEDNKKSRDHGMSI